MPYAERTVSPSTASCFEELKSKAADSNTVERLGSESILQIRPINEALRSVRVGPFVSAVPQRGFQLQVTFLVSVDIGEQQTMPRKLLSEWTLDETKNRLSGSFSSSLNP